MRDDIRGLAAKLRERYHTADPFELCDQLDILVLKLDLPQRVKGFYTKILSTQLIYINDALNEREQRVTCAHELGHALMHTEYNSIFISENTNFVMARYENEANLFCAELLIDEEEIAQLGMEPMTVDSITLYTGYPRQLVELKFGAG